MQQLKTLAAFTTMALVFLPVPLFAEGPMTVQLEIEVKRAWSAIGDVSEASATIVAYEPRLRKDSGTLYLVTTAHAIPAPMQATSIKAYFQTSGATGATTAARAHLLCARRQGDLAILSVRPPPDADFGIARIAPPPRLDQAVTALGFPAGAENTTRTTGSIAAVHTSFQREIRATATGPAIGKLELGPIVIHTARIQPGVSGGPLLDSDGRLLGIHVGRLNSPSDSPNAPSRSIAALVPAIPSRIRDLCKRRK